MTDVLVPVLFDDAGLGPSGATMQYVGAAITETRRLPTPQDVFHVSDYGAVGVAPGTVATIDETAQINACVDAAFAARGIVQFGNRGYKVTSINLKSGVTYRGCGTGFGDGTHKGTTIWGTPGSNNFLLPNAVNTGPCFISDMTIRGGLNGIGTPVGTTGTSNLIHIDRCFITGSNAAIYNDYYIDTWRLNGVYMSGGLYGWQLAPGTGVNSQMDKCTFINVYVSSAAKNCWRLEPDAASTSNTWINPVCTSAFEDGFYIGGPLNSCIVMNYNGEANGKTGKNHRTTLTGVVGSGATSGTLASLTAGGSSAAYTQLLSGAIASSGAVSTITLTTAIDSRGYQSGSVLIDSEAFHFTGISGSTLTGVTRAVMGTSMAAHSGGATVARIWSDGTHPNAGDGNTNVITIRGAGTSGANHVATITTLDVPTRVVTWSGATVTAVTDPKVTNAVYSEVKFASGGSGWIFQHGQFGAEGTGGRMRYGIDATALNGSLFLNSTGNSTLISSLYDPTGGDVNVYIGAYGRMGWDRANVARPGGGNYSGSPEVLTKAGAISDSDFNANTQPFSGTLALDTTNFKLYAKCGSAWKSVTLT